MRSYQTRARQPSRHTGEIEVAPVIKASLGSWNRQPHRTREIIEYDTDLLHIYIGQAVKPRTRYVWTVRLKAPEPAIGHHTGRHAATRMAVIEAVGMLEKWLSELKIEALKIIEENY